MAFLVGLTLEGNALGDFPTLEIMLNGQVVSSSLVYNSAGGSYTALFSFDVAGDSTPPSSVTLGFVDGLSELGRSIDVSSVTLNGIGQDLTNFTSSNGADITASMVVLEQNESATLTFTPTSNSGGSTYNGTGGDDVIAADAATHTYDGLAGNDTLDFSGITNGVFARIRSQRADKDNDGTDDTVLRNFENLTGSAFADVLFGDDNVNVLNGGDGNDVLRGYAGNDVLFGGDGDDDLYGYEGDDTVNGGAGADKIWGDDGASGASAGNDTLNGGDGNDIITAGGGNDIVNGGADNDLIAGNDGDDTLNGDGGTDIIYGGLGVDTINGGDGNDTIRGDAGNDILNGDDGDDIIYGGADNDTLDGGLGNNRLFGEGGDDIFIVGAGVNEFHGGSGTDSLDYSANLTGIEVRYSTNRLDSNMDGIFETIFTSIENIALTDFRDIVRGDATVNVFNGGDGNDSLYGFDGDDTLNGEDGNDALYGGSGVDTINGGLGIDFIYGENGNDIIDGGDGGDRLYGGNNDDTINGGDGNDFIYGENQNDTIDGGAGDDRLYGGEGVDDIQGGAGFDRLYGGNGNDILRGGDGADMLWGQGGDDTLYADADSAVLSGGDGNDTLWGSNQLDQLYGNSGNDILNAGDGDDLLKGHDGTDTLNAGAGDDTLIYVDSVDTFVGSTGTDTLTIEENSTEAIGIFGANLAQFTGIDIIDLANFNGAAAANVLSVSINNTNEIADGQELFIRGDVGLDDVTVRDYNIVTNFVDWQVDLTDNTVYQNFAITSGAETGNIINVQHGVNADGAPYGTGDEATIIGTVGADAALVGTGADELILGLDDDDRIVGGGGNDVLAGQAGDDILVFGDKNDFYVGGAGFDVIRFAENDTSNLDIQTADLGGFAGIEMIDLTNENGSADANTLTIRESHFDELTGGVDGASAFYVMGDQHVDTVITAGFIVDRDFQELTVFDGITYEHFNAGNNDLFLQVDINSQGPATQYVLQVPGIEGTAAGETINGSVIGETILGKDGDDTINGGDGTDSLLGGTGNDILNGDDGADYIYGDTGDDTLSGGNGNDTLYGDNTESVTVVEAGTLAVTQANSTQWHTVNFSATIENAVVKLFGNDVNGDPFTIRARNVTSTSFEFQLDEFDYQDGSTGLENISWIAVAAGSHTLSNGMKIQAGTTTATNETATGISFVDTSYSSPIVFSQVSSDNELSAVVTRNLNVTGTGFSVQMQEEENNADTHATEDIGWIAIEAGGGAANGFLASTTGDVVTHTNTNINFGGTFATTPVFIADMQTLDGGDTAVTAGSSAVTTTGAVVHIDEETSRDTEVSHTTENVGYVALEAGTYGALSETSGSDIIRGDDGDDILYADGVADTDLSSPSAVNPLAALILGGNPDAYWNLSETAGTSADNQGSLGASVDGTINGGATLGAAALYLGGGTAIDFDGVNDGIRIPDSAGINTGTYAERTVELVFNADDVTTRQVLFEEGATVNGLTIYIDGGRVYVTGEDDGNWVDANLSAAISTGTTYHVAFVFDQPNNSFEGFLDGVSMGSVTVDNTIFPSHSGDIGIGYAPDGVQFHDGEDGSGGYFFDGRISDVAIYNNALSQAQLQAHADIVTGTLPPAAAIDDTLYGGDGFDQFFGGAGRDAFVFEAASAFNDVDEINAFDVGEQDALDISDILTGFTLGVSDINDFVTVTTVGANSVVAVDANGAVGGASFTNIAQINNFTGVDADALFLNNSIIAV